MDSNNAPLRRGKIINCKKCGRVFRQVRLDVCAICAEDHRQAQSQIYKEVMKNPDLSAEEIAHQFDMPLHEVEQLFASGGLGMAAQTVKVKCHRCNNEFPQGKMKGKFCAPCAVIVEKEGGLDPLRKKEVPEKKEFKKVKRAENYDTEKPKEEPKPVLNDEKKDVTIKESRRDVGRYGFKRS